MITTFVNYLVACTVTYYLFARAEITRWAWSRYPRFLDRTARCAACSGWWLGAALSFYLPPPTRHGAHAWEQALWGAAWGLCLTPLGAWILLAALGATHVEATDEE